MLQQICEQLKAKIDDLPYKGKVSGLVEMAIEKIEETDESGAIYQSRENRFPVAMGVTGADCYNNAANYTELAPNSLYSSVMYFERMSDDVGVGEMKQGSMLEAAKVRLIVWLNLKKLGQPTGEKLVSVRNELIALCVSKEVSFMAFGNNYKAELYYTGTSHDASIFTKYSYDKTIVNNMLLYPYQYFAIDFKAVWRTSFNCDAFIPSPEIC